MRKHLLFIFFIFCCITSVRAQSGIELKGYYGISGNRLARKIQLTGSSSVNMESLSEFGLILSKGIAKKLRFNAGVNYTMAQVYYRPAPCPNCGMENRSSYVHNSDFEMVTIPVYLEYTFLKFLYGAVGPVVDFQTSHTNNFTDQSGVGYLVGAGAKYTTNKIVFSVFPHYKRHHVIPFEKTENKYLLEEFGLQFGIAYRF